MPPPGDGGGGDWLENRKRRMSELAATQSRKARALESAATAIELNSEEFDDDGLAYWLRYDTTPENPYTQRPLIPPVRPAIPGFLPREPGPDSTADESNSAMPHHLQGYPMTYLHQYNQEPWTLPNVFTTTTVMGVRPPVTDVAMGTQVPNTNFCSIM